MSRFLDAATHMRPLRWSGQRIPTGRAGLGWVSRAARDPKSPFYRTERLVASGRGLVGMKNERVNLKMTPGRGIQEDYRNK